MDKGMATSQTDLLILGGGSGGYVAAIKAAQSGLDVVLVEEDKLGGTCLHRGCIPTKALLRSAEVFSQSKAASDFGIDLQGELSVDFSKVQDRKQSVIDQLHAGVQALMKKNKIRVINARGVIMGPSIFSPVSGAVIVTPEGEDEEIIVPKKLLIATGSRPRALKTIDFDHEYILSSDDILQLETLPNKLAIIGGGVVGVEFASLMNSFGVEVTLFEYAERLLLTESKEVAKAFTKEISQRGIKVQTSAEVQDAQVVDGEVEISVKGEDQAQVFDKVLVAVGRQANVDNIGLNNTSIKFDEKGIQVNQFFQTAESHIYAIGDCIPSPQLAHVAMKEGEIAVGHLLEEEVWPLNYQEVPRCVYAQPEIASVGYHEDNVPEDIKAKKSQFSFVGNGKAIIHDGGKGFVNVLRDEDTDDLIGVSMIGGDVTQMISEASTAMYLNATPLEIGEAIHAHPTMSEALQEASLDSYHLAIHK
ncbi:dihydrolipoyl dehydrogenase [Aerococcus sp. YH-aer221]|nr:dihydrolipoyl dehydrogenase [Aerococcus sp. YH-aer221]MCZ0718017.1 dihydrolipoyl dehydrogenase [Aerococcus sp. YH-aer221]